MIDPIQADHGQDPNEEVLVEARSLCKSFPSSKHGYPPVEAVKDFSLTIDEGELVTIFGPNGCGKTTILNMLAGLITPDTGALNYIKAVQPSVGYVFQNHTDTLLPWRNVTANLMFPLEARNCPVEDREKKVRMLMEQFRLGEHADKYVYELSGGLKQLTSIARATIYDPQLLLLDEPFSALDYSLSRKLWLNFREFWLNRNLTTVFVSHNVDEAVFLGDRVIVLSARPARIIADIPVPLGKKRTLSQISSDEFSSVRKQVLEAFEGGWK